MDTAPAWPLHPLEDDRETDVCVVGAGIAGLTTALRLLQEGENVMVVDHGTVGSGQTERTTAHLSNALDDRYLDIRKHRGREGARLAAESHTAAIDFIERHVRGLGIDCDFLRVDGYLFLAPGHEEELLRQEQAAAGQAGLGNVAFLRNAPVTAFDTGPCLHFPRQAQFHPLHYLRGLGEEIERHHGHVYTGTHVSGVEENDGSIAVRTSENRMVTCKAAVLATNCPIIDNAAIYAKQAPYRTYVIGLDVPAGSVEPALFWDTADPYHYVRTQIRKDGRDLLITGGEDHRSGEEHEPAAVLFDRLEMWTRERFPMANAVSYRWSGQVMETVDGLAMIGRKPGSRHIYIATGDSGMGMTHGTIAGLLLSDLIMGKKNPWADLYDPGRAAAKALGAYARENMHTLAQFARRFRRQPDISPETPAPGTGAVLQQEGGSPLAVYRDEKGELHVRSALCPHRGCPLSWNAFEKTWDCGCHGSRFSAKGLALNGPSIQDLQEEKQRAERRHHS